MTPTELGLGRVFSVARRRLRLAWLTATGELALPTAAAAAVGLVLLGWLVPWTWPEPVALVAMVGTAVVLVGYAVLFRVSDFKVARALDRGLGSHDSITSALEITPDHPFSERVYRQARSVDAEDAGRAVPVRFNPKPWLLAGALLVAALVLA
ncbi:MAG: hypothetical protein WBM50_07615, partial [Acidimicrobiales bacterium]